MLNTGGNVVAEPFLHLSAKGFLLGGVTGFEVHDVPRAGASAGDGSWGSRDNYALWGEVGQPGQRSRACPVGGVPLGDFAKTLSFLLIFSHLSRGQGWLWE